MEKPIVRIYRRPVGTLVMLVALISVCMGGGCQPPYPYLLKGSDGQPIEMTQITEITTDTELTDDEKREALRNLGIDDELLIDLLIRDFSGQ